MRNYMKIGQKKMNKYFEFSNGRKMSPQEFASIIIRLRKTGSMEEIGDILLKEYKFTREDFKRFQYILLGVIKYWDEE